MFPPSAYRMAISPLVTRSIACSAVWLVRSITGMPIRANVFASLRGVTIRAKVLAELGACFSGTGLKLTKPSLTTRQSHARERAASLSRTELQSHVAPS